MDAHQCVTKLAAGEAFRCYVRHGVKIAKRLRHLLAVDQQVRAVQPVVHKFFSGYAFALCDLRLVVGKDVVDAAAMNVDLISKERGGHGAALNVPARPARPPWRIPFHIAVILVHAFHNAKSPTCSLSYSSCFTRPVDCSSSRLKCASFP